MKNKFLTEISNNIGEGIAHDYEYLKDNVSGYKKRRVSGILTPKTLAEVRGIINLAKTFPGVQLHPVSVGYNWGLGSKEDIAEGSYLLELKRLNNIQKMDLTEGWAIIEPGVTQADLSQKLRGSNRFINITASSSHSSFLGNAMDRGVGLRHQRTEDLVGLEVLLPDGKLIRVGWWPTDKPTPIYPHGIGPSLVQFFTQSSFGIVTAGVIRLHQRAEFTRVLRFTFQRDNLSQAILLLQKWVANKINSGVLKIYDTMANQTYGGKNNTYTVHMCIDGLKEHVNITTNFIIKECTHSNIFNDVEYFDDKNNNDEKKDIIAKLVNAAHVGETLYNDELLAQTLGESHSNIDEHGKGWLFFLPLIPFTPQALTQAYAIIYDIKNKTGITCGATINSLNEQIIDLVVSICFDKNSDEKDRAFHALDLLHQQFNDCGFIPYRLDIDHAHWARKITPNESEYNFIKELKLYLDSNNLISNDRYL
ncbi:FAD linked oxidase [Serratia sp. MYb239]|uniref:FAD-binding oxidoreductase n=1 Tax=Serratia sp. MYb239 TaxID=2033438 RepID=UPI000CF6607F|nr:FAD-dependent oxidoreductase [Serratia sp. MYb239]AVJ15705.1 FAD linked oxidase [Serratia sp. MYb239]